MSEKEF